MYLDSILLGLIQGVTEFLPISSSGHLIIFRSLLNEQVSYGLAFDAVLQLATTLAILIYFRKDIWNLLKSFFQSYSVVTPFLQRGLEYFSMQYKVLIFINIFTRPRIKCGVTTEYISK